MRRAVFLVAVLLCVPWTAASQARPATGPEDAIDVLPAIAFDVAYLKFLPPSTAFSPYYSWDASVAFDLVVVRRGRHSAELAGVVQSAGTENFGSRIGVGGAGYVLRVTIRRELSPGANVAAGVSHLSTHLTRDLDEKTDDERDRGAAIPLVGDPSEYNVPFFEWNRRFASRRFAPALTVGIAPVNVRLTARARGWNRRPVYASTRWSLWTRGGRSLVVETDHEAGAGLLNRLVGAFEIERARTSSRLRAFVSLSPGRGLHVSPHLGGVRDGWAVGLRLGVRAAAD